MYLNGLHIVRAVTGSPAGRIELVVVQSDGIGDVLWHIFSMRHQSLGNSLGLANQHGLYRLLVHKVIEHLVVIDLEVVHQASSLGRKAVRFGHIVSPLQKL